MSSTFAKPCVLTIAGSDSSGGAGIQADLKAISAQGCYGLAALTCIVAESPERVAEVKTLSAQLVASQIKVLFEGFPIRAVKTGLLRSSTIVRMVAKVLKQLAKARGVPIVVDPVMLTSTGDSLVFTTISSSYLRDLIPLATLVTPNLDELGVFAKKKVNTYTEMRQVGRRLSREWGIPLLLKGGHLRDKVARDLLVAPAGEEWEYKSPFHPDVMAHGTGCTFSAAITAQLALGKPLEQAVDIAKGYMDLAVRCHLAWGRIQVLEHFPNLPAQK
ncbi:Hydroxymethylpyrimidine/phosphomethylpyrimidine kinase [Candidatus Xiphinematobacter sp. Idaho Grape]|uniref:bifunctional hydroxymethylpyrimidine kinase/phosphomethylpyrimidine kinase n=1 Tax=Candidatus Xiphinematobacter sp. Idaho Grape TaxID=1704307 RepID=UPI000706401F|nr:bifunctional hydroxymethylpyrimidine kinase/phosphomethylpyrimidine kinase [Candidatus Xiphinematobacter sp. Idaho Grape]ALJ56470.1 Hydroxymethylpyrimidine/phosphomethylpyrimidine kinase [Candidatus Xiphinematobacter sp. Idaho Grape]